VTNTALEAHAVATLLRARQATPLRGLLLTSAFQMLRARRFFERTGLAVVPLPVDFQYSAGGGLDVMDFLLIAQRASGHFMREAPYGRSNWWLTCICIDREISRGAEV
jgi:uncharacterized SAM-binding protein YcdF (DUF218 family)